MIAGDALYGYTLGIVVVVVIRETLVLVIVVGEAGGRIGARSSMGKCRNTGGKTFGDRSREELKGGCN